MTKTKPWNYSHRPLISYDTEEWFIEARKYLNKRFPPILNKLLNIFRYVELDPFNALSFSYEFSSLLRDIGGTFSSVLDYMVKGHNNLSREQRLNIDSYRIFLNDEINNLEGIAIYLNVDFDEKIIFPFEGFSNEQILSVWWNAYNDVKHLDIYTIKKGCLSNVLYSFSALSVLQDCMTRPSLWGQGVVNPLIIDIMEYRTEIDVMDEQDHYEKELTKGANIFPRAL